jgi:hypothetical protein
VARTNTAPPHVANVPGTPLGRMYCQHILNKDFDNLLDQYCDDALLISSFTRKPLYYKGRDQIKQHMDSLLGVKGAEDEHRLLGRKRRPTNADDRQSDRAGNR